jgi:hypothetical protein
MSSEAMDSASKPALSEAERVLSAGLKKIEIL